MRSFSKALNITRDWYGRTCRAAFFTAEKHSNKILFLAGVALLGGGLENLASAQTIAGGGIAKFGTAVGACGLILQYIETGFGALVASAAGIGAIIAAAVGGFKAAWGLLVVSIGSFILRAYLTLFHSGC